MEMEIKEQNPARKHTRKNRALHFSEPIQMETP